jgi:hypothetical protein
MRPRPAFLRALSLPALAGLIAACSSDTSAPVDHATMHMSAAAATASTAAQAGPRDLARIVRIETTRFKSQANATKAGYVASSPCVAAPGLGGMGFHWVNQALVDPVFQPGRPEAVLYDMQGRLIAVEYIVIDVGQPRPSFGGQLFDIGGTPVPVPHYSLHAWVHFENPTGMFTPFNPRVVCS